MKFLYFTISALFALSQAAHGRVQEKLVAAYSDATASPVFAAASQSPVVYTRGSRPSLEQKTVSEGQQLVGQPAAYASNPNAQQFYQAQPQSVAYPQPVVAKYVNAPAGGAGQKIAFAQPHQLQRRPQQYSSAADVSSFSYTSPVVAYSNLGVLRPATPPRHQQQAQPIVQPAATSFVPSQSVVQYASPNSASNAYEASGAYQAISQKAAYAEAQPQASSYQTAPVNQKFIYQAVPASVYQQVQAAQKLAPQVAFAPSQQYYQNPQAATPQNYEAVAQSAPQVFYAQPATQLQYYPQASQSKYADPDIIYGH